MGVKKIMPSGSHRSSPGSHSSRSYSSHSSVHHTSIVPIFMMNRHYRRHGSSDNSDYEEIRKSPLIGFLSTIFSIMIVALIAVIIAKVAFVIRVQAIKNDYDYYQHMCSWSAEHPNWKGTAKVTGKQKKYDKWLITYKIIDPTTNFTLDGYSFAIYDDEQIEQIQIDDEIEVAMNSFNLSIDTDSVPMDYYQVPITQDADYLHYTKISSSVTVILVIVAVLTIGLGITNGILVNKRLKDAQGNYVDSSYTQVSESNLQAVYCDYCHSKLPPNSTMCEHCGASTRQNKN